MNHNLYTTLLSAALLLSGCGPTPPCGGADPMSPEGLRQAACHSGVCKCVESGDAALYYVVDWPAAHRTILQDAVGKGVIAVRYSGCQLEPLFQCRVPGTYRYQGVSAKHEHVALHSECELRAFAPLAVASMKGKLKKAGHIDVDMVTVGSYATCQPAVYAGSLQGNCAGATHIVSHVVVGAFGVTAGGNRSGEVDFSTYNVGIGGTVSNGGELLVREGDITSCRQSNDRAPAANCRGPLMLSLAPLSHVPVGPPPAECTKNCGCAPDDWVCLGRCVFGL